MDILVSSMLSLTCFMLCLEGYRANGSTTPTANVPECVCSCLKNEIPTDVEERKKLGQEQAEKIKEELEVDKTVLSATVRKKKSAKDDRPSAQNVGYLGVAMLSLSMSLILVMDVQYVIQMIHSFYVKTKESLTRRKLEKLTQ